MKPLEDGPLPTRIWLAEGQPFQLAGPIKGDEPPTLQDSTLHMDVELYEGAAAFTLPLKVATGAALAGCGKRAPVDRSLAVAAR